MSPLLALSILMRAVHLVAGAVWVGGSAIYLVVIIPALRVSGASSQTSAALGSLFRQVVNVCIGAVLLTGVYLVFDRLGGLSGNSAGAGALYVIVLVVKIAAALAMITLAALQAQEARRPPSHRGRLWRLAPRWILGLGLLTFLLGAALVGIYSGT